MRLLGKQVDEIAEDPVLRFYGVALAMVNAVTAVFWLTGGHFSEILDPKVAPICWPFLDSCQAFRIASPVTATGLVVTLLFAAIANATLFTQVRWVRSAYWLLVGLSLLKAALLLQDYRLILNQHYMAYATVGTFLFVPGKRRILQYLLVSFYLWAGTLKLNSEWISGLGLYGRHPMGLPTELIPAACLYVIVLELLIVLGVFSRREWVFRAAFIQIILFHISSFWVVGFFYPTLMFLLLSIIPMARYWPPAEAGTPLGIGPGLDALWHRQERPATYALLAGFCLLQLVPFMFPGNPSISGEGRMFALHMFDAPVECHATATFRPEGADAQTVRLQAPFANPRIMCDPIIFFNLARDYCRAYQGRLRRGDLDLALDSRKQGRQAFQTVIAIQRFCASNPSYSPWRHNSWIHPTS